MNGYKPLKADFRFLSVTDGLRLAFHALTRKNIGCILNWDACLSDIYLG